MEIMRALFFLISSHEDIPARCIKSRCVTLRIEALYRKPSASPKKPGDSIFFMHTSLTFPEKCRLGWQKITENARHRMSAVAHSGHRSWICHQSVEGTKPTAKYRSIQQASKQASTDIKSSAPKMVRVDHRQIIAGTP
jgi:hypothetical protein